MTSRESVSAGRRHLGAIAVALVLAVVAAACTGDGGTTSERADGEALRVLPLSAPASYVTGGEVVVGIDSPAGADLDDVSVTVDGTDVSDRFRLDQSSRPAGSPVRLVGLLEGLPDGASTVTASTSDGDASVELENHPIDGPLFSGPHQSPFVCTTAENGLGAAGDECWAQTRVTWKYRSTTGSLVDLPDPSTPPTDVDTTTVDGRTVPFIVRIEQGVFNRSIATYAVLDPSPGTGTPAYPTAGGDTTGTSVATTDTSADATGGGVRTWDSSGWNGRLVMRFGGGCGATFSQGSDDAEVLDPDLLGLGYAIVGSSLTTFQTACNPVLSAETALVLKEHFIETYGIPRVTIGNGESGGAIQQLQIAQNYPGILDALAPTLPFPDALSIAPEITDCGLLLDYFGGAGSSLSPEQRNAIVGFASTTTCAGWAATFLPTIDPSVGCDPELDSQVFDAETNPRGVRCTMQDSNINVFGVDPATGYAQRPLDNVGVQYGLAALNRGIITIDEFLDLNEGIGGFDIDGQHVAERETASDEVFERAYRAGQVTAASVTDPETDAQSATTTGGQATTLTGALDPATAGGLVDVPIILTDVYTDNIGDIHDRQRVFAIAQRLRTPDGSPDPNLVVWTIPGGSDLATVVDRMTASSVDAIQVLDEWVTAAQDAGGSEPLASRLADRQPTNAVDTCELPDGKIVTGPDIYSAGSECSQAYPLHSSPRQVAGAPLTLDTLACTLQPVDPTSPMYSVPFSDRQAERLQAIFPDGVCDWTVPGRGQVAPDGTWQVFDTP